MSELRQNFFTKEWVIIATDRAKRPDQMVVRSVPGNENQTPPEVLRLPTIDKWTIPVAPISSQRSAGM